MEHRWGGRIGVDVPVQLRCVAGAVGAGRLINASVTGAFIRTAIVPPVMARIDVLVEGFPISAFVARNAAEGIGVEWCNSVPQIISALLTATDTVSSAGPAGIADRGVLVARHHRLGR